MMEIMYWMFALLTVYPYVVYPIILHLLVRFYRAPSAPQPSEAPELPTVTVIVSARNEEAVIEQKIQTTLDLDYPADHVEIVVVSDASTDLTNGIVRDIGKLDPRVKLIEFAEHLGKTAGLNQAMETIDSDIVVFTDANAIFENSAIRHLVDELKTPGVGYAVGSALYTTEAEMTAGENEGLYWRYELAVKRMESEFESVVGGDGAIYAIWRRLYRPLAPEDINDFMNPLHIIGSGYRGVFSSEAIAYEEPANDFYKEFNRKRRIVCRSWGAVRRF